MFWEKDWKKTREGLRQAVRVVSAARVSDVEPTINRFEHSLTATPYGATTGKLSIGELKLDYSSGKILLEKDGDAKFEIDINGKTQRDLFEEVKEKVNGIDPELNISDEKLKGEGVIEMEDKVAGDLAAFQYNMHEALSLFKERLPGETTPIALWPHGLDQSLFWFKSGLDEKKDPHMHFGISPGSGEEKDQPYVYYYAWPEPDELKKMKLPANGEYQKDWQTPGVRFDIDWFIGKTNPQKEIAGVLLQSFKEVSPRIRNK